MAAASSGAAEAWAPAGPADDLDDEAAAAPATSPRTRRRASRHLARREYSTAAEHSGFSGEASKRG